MDHIKYIGDIGYGYTKTNIQYMATEFCQSLGKKNLKSEKGLSSMWFHAFMKPWPDLKGMKPQNLLMSRAKSASRESIDIYFRELGTVLQQNDLMEAPERIFNIDETRACTAEDSMCCRKLSTGSDISKVVDCDNNCRG